MAKKNNTPPPDPLDEFLTGMGLEAEKVLVFKDGLKQVVDDQVQAKLEAVHLVDKSTIGDLVADAMAKAGPPPASVSPENPDFKALVENSVRSIIQQIAASEQKTQRTVDQAVNQVTRTVSQSQQPAAVNWLKHILSLVIGALVGATATVLAGAATPAICIGGTLGALAVWAGVNFISNEVLGFEAAVALRSGSGCAVVYPK